MPRNDSILNTGVTSHSINKAKRTKEERERKKKEKQDKQTKLAPAAELINLEISREIEDTQLRLLKTITPDTPDEKAKDIIASLNLYAQSMKNLKHRLTNIMRVKEDKGV